MVDPRTSGALRNEMRCIVLNRICEKMDGVALENPLKKNESQRIIAQDAKAFVLKFAEENVPQDDEQEIGILRKSAAILRRRVLKFRQKHQSKPENFKVSFDNTQQDYPAELASFLEGMLLGSRKLVSGKSAEKRNLVTTTASIITHDIKTDRQVAYDSKRKDRSMHAFTTTQQVGLGLAIRHSDQNNEILKLLSAPNYGFTITPRQCLEYETMIANAV